MLNELELQKLDDGSTPDQSTVTWSSQLHNQGLLPINQLWGRQVCGHAG